MHFHWQNLNEKPAGRRGTGLRHGRAFWHFEHGRVHCEWVLGRLGFHLGFEANDEGVLFTLDVPLATLYLGVEDFKWLRRLQPKEYRATTYPPLAPGYWTPKHRRSQIAIHGGGLWFTLWGDPDSWTRRLPWWSAGVHLDFRDFLFGRAAYSKRVLSVTETVVPMPERAYPCTVTLEESTWTRPRWFPLRRLFAEVDVPGGIVHPGKGENSYDIDDDATYSLSCGASTVEEAVAAMVKSVMRDRRRHGGSVNWQPREPAL